MAVNKQGRLSFHGADYRSQARVDTLVDKRDINHAFNYHFIAPATPSRHLNSIAKPPPFLSMSTAPPAAQAPSWEQVYSQEGLKRPVTVSNWQISGSPATALEHDADSDCIFRRRHYE